MSTIADRNRYEKEHEQLILELVSKYGFTQGCRKAALQLRRTEKAVAQKYAMLKKKLPESQKPVLATSTFGKIVLHNGVSKEATVIAQTDSIIVAQAGNIVVTIERKIVKV